MTNTEKRFSLNLITHFIPTLDFLAKNTIAYHIFVVDRFEDDLDISLKQARLGEVVSLKAERLALGGVGLAVGPSLCARSLKNKYHEKYFDLSNF
jgi:hypothetical protein